MKNWVAGFLFSADLSRVAMVRKNNKVPHLEGKLNAIGGKIELGESAVSAMSREFLEEAGVLIPAADWTHTLTLEEPGQWRVQFFCAVSDKVWKAQQMTDEEILLYDWQNEICRPDTQVTPNTRWILPLCLDNELVKPVHVMHQGF